MARAPKQSQLRTEDQTVLAELYAQDRAEHGDVPPVGTPGYRALRERDRARRERAACAIEALRAFGRMSYDIYSLSADAIPLNRGATLP